MHAYHHVVIWIAYHHPHCALHHFWHKCYPSSDEHAGPVKSIPQTACGGAGVSEARAEDGSVQQEVGGGISGSVDGRRVALGNWTWVAQHLRDPKSQPPESGPSTSLAAGASTRVQQQLQVGAYSPSSAACSATCGVCAHAHAERWWVSTCRCLLRWTARQRAWCHWLTQCEAMQPPPLRSSSGKACRPSSSLVGLCAQRWVVIRGPACWIVTSLPTFLPISVR